MGSRPVIWWPPPGPPPSPPPAASPWPSTMVAAMISRMMPLATPSAPGEQCGGGQHLAPDAALGGFRHARGHAEERNQRDLGPDPDQEQQERVDDEGGVQRFELFHPGTVDHTEPAAERNAPQLTPTG